MAIIYRGDQAVDLLPSEVDANFSHLDSVKIASVVVETGETAILNVVSISQADYDNITTPVATTLYVIV